MKALAAAAVVRLASVTSDDDNERSSDPDRAAILARRKHFIAVALSGLATGLSACTSSDKVTPGAEPAVQPGPPLAPQDQPPPEISETGSGETGSGETGETEAPAKPEPRPRPCLKKPAPRPCLNIAPQNE